MERATEPTTSRGRYYEGQGTVVPTGAELRSARMAEELYVPYFAKATKGCFTKSHAYGQKVQSASGDRSGILRVYRYRQARGIGRQEFCYRCLQA